MMSFLQKFDFNRKTGYWSVVFVSIAISLLIFSLAYLVEGIGWLGDETHGWVGWNWIKGSGVAFVIMLILAGLSKALLGRNSSLPERREPLFGKLDLNARKGLLGLVCLSVSAVFFFNGIFYRQEASRWYWAAVETGTSWMFTETSAWTTSSTIMILIGILLSAVGWTSIALQLKRK